MKETSPSQTYTDRIRLWARTHGGKQRSTRGSNEPDVLPVSNPIAVTSDATQSFHETATISSSKDAGSSSPSAVRDGKKSASNGANTGHGSTVAPSGASPQASGPGSVLDGQSEKKEQKNIAERFLKAVKIILFHTKLNILLVFVPIGIAVGEIPGMSPAIIFAMNAVAIVPLAGLLSFATETVARKLGDSLGALLNVTFGNAVELIIFIIALVKDEIRIVQASLLGSILANLLLILGMSFLLGGLRFREQIYNSTVTQMSACLLSLSVISLVLPTAFHASFDETKTADATDLTLKISRGTSVILLLVYIIYLLFQLVSHSYMYESTPQHIIDEEATPGPVANWLNSSSSESSSSSDSDSSDSSHSRNTVSRRVKRVMRGNRRRKNSVVSIDTNDGVLHGPTRTPSFGTTDTSGGRDEVPSEESSVRPKAFGSLNPSSLGAGEEAVDDDKPRGRKRRYHYHRHSRKHRKSKHKSHHAGSQDNVGTQTIQENVEMQAGGISYPGEPRRVDFAVSNPALQDEIKAEVSGSPARAPFLRGITRNLAPTVFTRPADATMPMVPAGPVPLVRYGIRRTNSLPDRLNQRQHPAPGGHRGAMMPSQIPLAAVPNGAAAELEGEHEDHLSRTSAVFLLLVSTALVAVCAEFMVSSINGLVASGDVGEMFIGLIVLPIVGNAAEHVTAITVAMKNKMDLAIGVAVGSSIQIALFVTPLIVIIGWCMDRQMTLYFTLFETVCLFVSTFIANFLVLDGRSNYLEGALLVATYVIIGIMAFFYPKDGQAGPMGAGT